MNTIKFFALVFIVCLCLAPMAEAQQRPVNLVLMALSAHPDDEDGATIAYYSKFKRIKTYSVVFTRGEGGQNEIGSELGDELGEIRTRETLEAGQILGADVLFLGFPDFGFSKTAQETFTKWGGYDTVLARLVYTIRTLKPDIIITNHDTITTKPNRQHGNHQAVGITAYDAFQKAADASYQPASWKHTIPPWQVKRLFFRFLNRGNVPQDSLVTVDVQKPKVGAETIEQIAMNALARHRSQGMDKFDLDSIPSYFRKHFYYRVRTSEPYQFSKNELSSGIKRESRQPLPASTLTFERILLKQPKSNDPTKIKAVFSDKINIGVITTYDKTLEQTLESFNVRYEVIDSATIASGNLKKYTTIALDLRAYEHRTDAIKHNDRLLTYVNEGGNLLCFYHKQGDWNGKNFAPYPITLTGERVTDENAPVTMLLPDHPLFAVPNRITENDWNNWAQERSVYLPDNDTNKTSARYERLLAMSDSEEQQPPTSLLHANYGKGTYTYCSLALYRQLRNYHEGAVKLLFNCLSQTGKK